MQVSTAANADQQRSALFPLACECWKEKQPLHSTQSGRIEELGVFAVSEAGSKCTLIGFFPLNREPSKGT